jgi:predicted DNA-binding transcriptional regulator YafY
MAVYRRLLEGLGGASDHAPTVRELLLRSEQLAKGAPGRRALARQIREATRAGATLTLDYTDRYGPGPLTHRKTVTLQSTKLPYFDGYCHTLGEARTFHIRRVQRILSVQT